MSTEIRKIVETPSDFIGKEVVVEGWIKTSRDSKTFGFLGLSDGTTFNPLQIVYDESLENFKEITKFPISTSVKITGVVVESPKAKQPIEIQAKNVEVLGMSDNDYPLQNKRHSLEYMRTIAHLRPRSNTYYATFKVRSILSYALHKFFQDQNFVYVHTPIVTASDAEGAGEMFQITTLDLEKEIPKTEDGKVNYKEDFFGAETNLTVSGQMEAEVFAHAFRNIYTFGPTFRAENSNTPRHAAEFWMLEPEVAFAGLDDIMDLSEAMLKYVIEYTLEHAKDEMNFFNQFIDKTLLERLDVVLNSDFGRVTYTEAIDLLLESGKKFNYKVEWGMDLQTEHERYLAEEVFKRPVFVTDYPKDIKAFYMRLNEDGKTVAATDLLVPGVGELIGGSAREERLDVLEEKMTAMDMDLEDYWWYLELRKYGTTKHAGYGLGFERLIMYVTGMTNIRDVIPFPRTVGSVDF